MIQLVDATGQSIRADKKGYINDSLPPILKRLGTDELNQFKSKGRKAIGTIEKLK